MRSSLMEKCARWRTTQTLGPSFRFAVECERECQRCGRGETDAGAAAARQLLVAGIDHGIAQPADGVNARTSGIYLRADPADLAILDGNDDSRRAELIAEQLRRWKSIA